jgi:glutamine phosphoribosylpyrophosphate amidotransferase
MSGHVHLVVTPADGDGLRATFAEAHRRHTGTINARFRWTGHLFQGRFGAVVMDEPHLLAAARYIVLNPVVAGLVSRGRRAEVASNACAVSAGRNTGCGSAKRGCSMIFLLDCRNIGNRDQIGS